jgi:GAF domain-containing protein
MKPTYFRFRDSKTPKTNGGAQPKRAPGAVEIASDSAMQQLRERILNRIFAFACVLGLIAYLAYLPLLLGQRQWTNLVIYTLLMLVLLFISFVHRIFRREIPYTLRAATLLVILYAVGLLALLVDGLYGSGRVFLIILPILASIFLGVRGRNGGLILSIGTMVIVGLLMTYGVIRAPALQPSTSNDNLLSWVVALFNFMLITITTTVALFVLLRNLEQSLQSQKALAETVESERVLLEQRVQQRGQDLERRVIQMRTAAEISRSISTVLEIDQLLPQVCELLGQRFGLYYVGIFLLDSGSAKNTGVGRSGQGGTGATQYAVLAAATGEAGQKMLTEGHKLAVGSDSMIGWATANRQARIALDVGKEAVRFDNPYLPETRSEIALPILSGVGAGQKVLGAITIQSRDPSAFDQDDVTVLQGIADSLASAIENARLFAEEKSNLEEIQILHRQYLQRGWSSETAALLAAQGRIDYTYQPAPVTPKTGQPTSTPETGQEVRFLEVPIKLRDQVIGNLTLEAEPRIEMGVRATDWSPEELALIETITSQAALALENARLLDDTRRRAEGQQLTASITSKVWASSNVEAILRTALQELAGSLQATEGWIKLEVGE